jgi:probable HAF family extracellular repeat protein
MENLGVLAGESNSEAWGASADGSVIVGLSEGASTAHAFRWTAAGGMRSLQDILTTDYGLGGQLVGWDLSFAIACSADGRVITGVGGDPAGQSEAWIARLDAPPHVAATQVNDGSVQRSRVTSLQMTFDTQVSFSGAVASAFTLTRTGGGSVNFQASASVINGVTVVTLNAFSGNETQFGSLKDGRYTLTALASQISAGGQHMTSNYTFGDAQGLFRFFGDINGDRHVDIADFGLFSSTFNLSTGQTGFISAFDSNNDGHIDIADFGQFSLRLFTVLP